MRTSFIVSYMITHSFTSCMRSLSDETMVAVAPASQAMPRISGDQIVGLVPGLLEAGDLEGLHRLADQRKLRNEVVRRRRPVRLVLLVHLRAERLFRFVEDHREMGRPLIRLHLLEQLPQHAAEPVDRIDMRAIGGARLEPDRVVSAEDVAGTVHQEHVVALFNGTGRDLWRG